MIDFISDHKWIISLLLMFVVTPAFIGLSSIENLKFGFQIYFIFMAVCSCFGGIVTLVLFLIYESGYDV